MPLPLSHWASVPPSGYNSGQTKKKVCGGEGVDCRPSGDPTRILHLLYLVFKSLHLALLLSPQIKSFDVKILFYVLPETEVI